MPNIHVSLPETEQSIFRPIVIGVVKQVQEITKLDAVDVYFPSGDKYNTSGATLDSKTDLFVETTSKRMNYIQVEETIDPGEISPTFFNGKEYPPIFEDRACGVIVSPVYAKHNVVITFKYSCGSKTESVRWLQDFRMALSRLRNINQHEAQYQYNIHKSIAAIIAKVYEYREKVAPYGQTFNQYFEAHTTPRLTVVGTLTGHKSIFAVAEKQVEIYGEFDFDTLPSKSEKDDSGMWQVEFSYKFNYDKPIGCHIRYPILVHQQLMPLEWVSFTADETRSLDKQVTDMSRTQSALSMFRADRVMDRIKAEDGIIRIPKFDDFKGDSVLHSTAGILQALATITETDRKSLLSLQDLDDIVLDQEVIKFFRESEYLYLNQPCKSFFNISLYQNGSLQDWRRLSVDSRLNVSATRDLDLRNQYRVRLSLSTDLDFVTPEAFQRIRKYPKVMYLVVSSINKAFRENPELKNLLFQGYIKPDHFNPIYRHILGKESYEGTGQIGWNISGFLAKNGITPDLMKKIKYEFNMPARTMITGVIVRNARDPDLYNSSLDAGKLNIN